MNVSMIGFDIAKGVVQVHGVDACGQVAVRKRLSRAGALAFFERLKPCVVGLEACGGAHYWARELSRMGHEARLIAPHYVKPYVKRSKTDAADAAGICEAVGRRHMRFVPIKSLDEQAQAQAHKARSLLVARRTALVNALRAHLTEFGIVAPVGPAGSARLIELLRFGEAPIPDLAVEALVDLCDMIEATAAKVAAFDARLKAVALADEACRRLMKVPGVGPVAAGAIRALAGDVTRFANGRDFAAWLGLTPRRELERGQNPARRHHQGRRSRPARPFGSGAMAVFRHASAHPEKAAPWVAALIKRRPPLVAAVAMAAKTARIIWAMLARGEAYRSRCAIQAG
jgi:transposase